MSKSRFSCFCVALLALAIATSPVQAQFDQASRWVPAGANVIALVRGKDILESEYATANKWRAERTRAYKSGAAFLPPSTERLLLAAQVDFEFQEPAWQVTVFENDKPTLDIIELSKRINGSIENISGNDAVVLPGDAYAVKIDDKTLVSMYPANRQVTARWIRENKRSGSKLSPYLSQAVRFADNNAQVMIALDLQDVVSHEAIKKKLANTALFPGDSVDDACGVLCSIRGLQFGITINDRINGAIKIDFDENLTPIADQAKDLLILALENNGIMIEDIRDWTATVNAKQITLAGTLSDTGLRQVGSFIEQPLVTEYASDYEGEGPDMKTRTLQYMAAVTGMVESLQNKDEKGLQTQSKWLEKYALQIDKLPVANVDEAALEYGQFVSTSFRDMSVDLMGVQLETMQNRASVPDEYWAGGVGGWGWGGGRWANFYQMNDYKTRNQTRATNQGQLKGQSLATQQMAQISKATVETRRDLSLKYEVEF